MTNEGDWVFDPFMGVGSTAVAALINGRNAIGAEIMPEYVKIAKERIKLAEKGELRIRPMERDVYDPNNPNNIPPKYVKIKFWDFIPWSDKIKKQILKEMKNMNVDKNKKIEIAKVLSPKLGFRDSSERLLPHDKPASSGYYWNRFHRC